MVSSLCTFSSPLSFFVIFLIWFFFFSHFPVFYPFHLVEVYKDVHRRSELIGWADSQSASKKRATQNPSRQEGTGKRMMCRRWCVFVTRSSIGLWCYKCLVVLKEADNILNNFSRFHFLFLNPLPILVLFSKICLNSVASILGSHTLERDCFEIPWLWNT